MSQLDLLFPDLFDTLAGIIKPVTDSHLQKYYNTTGLSGEALAKQEIKTGTQNWLILQWFRQHPGEWTPSEVWQRVNLPGVPLTSIRRSITNLTDWGYLERTDCQRQGLYGKPEGCWRVKK